jgi:uncharacterized membrane protein YfcA
MNFLLNAIFGTIAGVTGAMGLGGGAILIIYLTVILGINQVKAQSINLIFFIPIALISTLIYSQKKMLKWNLILRACIPGIAGSILGSFILQKIDPYLLRKAFGISLLVLGLELLFNVYEKIKKK